MLASFLCTVYKMKNETKLSLGTTSDRLGELNERKKERKKEDTNSITEFKASSRFQSQHRRIQGERSPNLLLQIRGKPY